MNIEPKWKNIEFDEYNIDFLSDQVNVSKLLAKVLNNAGFTEDNYDDIEKFINPKMSLALDYKGISSEEELQKSFKRIELAIKNKEKVVVNGDPDADGISGTTVLVAALRFFGLEVDYAFPVRSKEGHGIQVRIIQDAIKKGATLIVSTDCGTKDVEAIDFANENNIDVIVTDHHILGRQLPNAAAIINPYVNKVDDESEHKYISGSYVSFKWVVGLKEYLKKPFPKDIFECLVICASLGVLSDRVSLKKPMNRVIVKLGIDYLNNTKLAGMKALKEISIPTKAYIRARDISRTIAPRMNAPGRIGDPELGIPDSTIIVDLLLAGLSVGPRASIKSFIAKYKKILQQDKLMKTDMKVSDQVEIVDEVNDKRKRMTEEIESIIEEMLKTINIENERVLIIQGKNWNSGIIGIDADRLRERFLRPTIVITSLEGSEFIKGSVRSLQTIDMYQVMENVQEKFMAKHGRNPYRVKVETKLGDRFVNAFGGHSQACGFSMHQNDLIEWELLVREEVASLDLKNFDFTYHSTAELNFYKVNKKLLSELDTLAPYGEGFDFPIFTMRNIKLSSHPRPFGNRMQKDRTPHVEFKVTAPGESEQKNKRFLRSTGFGLWEKYQEIVLTDSDKLFDIIFTLDYPRKGDSKQPFPQLNVLDFKRSKKG